MEIRIAGSETASKEGGFTTMMKHAESYKKPYCFDKPIENGRKGQLPHYFIAGRATLEVE